MRLWKRSATILALSAAMVGALVAPTATASETFPDVIELPDGFFPEGIAAGQGTTFYVGSLSTGAIFKGDARTGEGSVINEGAGPFSTVGLDVDQRNHVWVAGGPSGTGRVYSGSTGELLLSCTFTAPFESFINDVIVTQDAAYFTDSGTSSVPADPANFVFAGETRLFVVPLDQGAKLPGDCSGREELDLNGVPDLVFPNLNGIETSPDGKHLIVGHTTAESLYQVDPASGDASEISLETGLVGNDGLVRRGDRLFVVENALAQITEVLVSSDGSSGSIQQVFLVPGSETPTTAALIGNALYAVDAKFISMTGPYFAFRIELN